MNSFQNRDKHRACDTSADAVRAAISKEICFKDGNTQSISDLQGKIWQ